MRQILVTVAVTYLILMNFSATSSDDTIKQARVKRFLSIYNQSLFIIRLNFKVNMVPWNQIFAQAMGFRLNFEEPPDTFQRHGPLKLHRRDLYKNMEILFNRNGLDGFSCIRRAICELHTLPPQRSMYYKLLKIIFRRQSSTTDKWHSVTNRACSESTASCPFSLLDVSTYTDI